MVHESVVLGRGAFFVFSGALVQASSEFAGLLAEKIDSGGINDESHSPSRSP